MSKKIVLVSGSNGLLGQKLTDLYLNEFNRVDFYASATGPNRHPRKGDFNYLNLDITNKNEILEIFDKIKPHTFIHTAAMTNVDACEADKEKCKLLNVDAVNFLIEACNKFKTHFIHLSTDFIFDGAAGPYKETDPANPLSYYGWSKLEAENLLISKSNNWSILRTILVYGIVNDMSRSNIVLWAKSALESGKELKVVDDQFRMPTLAEDLAMGCFLCEKLNANGIFNISGKDFMSVYEMVERVAQHYGLKMDTVQKVKSDTLNQAAKRPLVTGFDLTKSQQILGYNPHSFEEGMNILDEQIKSLSH